MKISYILKTSLLSFLIIITAFNVSAQQKSRSTAKECTIRVNFKGEKAKSRIEQELKREKGIIAVDADTAGKTVKISYNEKITNPEKLNLAIEKMGYVTAFTSIKKKKIRCCRLDSDNEETKK